LEGDGQNWCYWASLGGLRIDDSYESLQGTENAHSDQLWDSAHISNSQLMKGLNDCTKLEALWLNEN
jgi:hypothetical protein